MTITQYYRELKQIIIVYWNNIAQHRTYRKYKHSQ